MTDNHPISEQQIRQAIHDFLEDQYQEKSKKIQKKLEKATQEADIAKAHEELQALKNKYNKKTWLQEAKKMTKTIQIGTHISKAVHSNSKGDNVNFMGEVHHQYVNTPTPNSPLFDGNSSAGATALPFIAFFDWQVSENPNLKIRDVILQNSPAVMASFDDDIEISKSYQQAFLDCLTDQITEPTTCERNKQILWANAEGYRVLVPLYPTVLAHEIFLRINNVRYSDTNKTAHNNRHKKTGVQQPYISIKDLAVLKLGGSNPQNTSYLISKQSGRNYLLPSQPLQFRQSQDIRILPNAQTIFESKSLQYKLKDSLESLFHLIGKEHNNATIRQTRKEIVSEIIYQVISIAAIIQQTRPAGWSKDYQLAFSQKYWLDPQRGTLIGEEEFGRQREQTDWQSQISIQFANWLQATIRQEFADDAHNFGDAEHQEWQSQMKNAIKQSVRLDEGVF